MNKRWTRTAEQRYWDKVDQRGPEECWPWIGSKTGGYGSIYWQGKSGARATRVGWRLIKGELPRHLCVLHHCDHPWCHNPEHWFLGTRPDNNKDRHSKGRYLKGHIDEPNQKLTWQKVDTMRADYATGQYSQRELAARYGVSQAKVWHVVNFQSWRPSERGQKEPIKREFSRKDVKPETREKMRLGRLAALARDGSRLHSEETKAKIAFALRGKHYSRGPRSSPETRAKMSAAQKAAWVRRKAL